MCTTTARRPANRTPILFAYDESGGGVEMNDPGPCPTCRDPMGWFVRDGKAVPMCPVCFRYGPSDLGLISEGNPLPYHHLSSTLFAAMNIIEAIEADPRYRPVKRSVHVLKYLLESTVESGFSVMTDYDWLGTSALPPRGKPRRRRATANA